MVRRYNEITQQFFRGGDIDAFDEVIAPNFVHHGPAMMPTDLAGFKQMGPAFRAAFPDIELTIEDLFAEGDRVADIVTVRGSHQGDFFGIPATGKRIEMQEIHVARVAGGKIVERWTQFDVAGLMQQVNGS